jgi:formylglycine-generating enzyme required for sulfatase activity
VLAPGLAVLFASCTPAPLPSEGHLVVFLDTDAPLSAAGEIAGVETPMALLDVVSLEVLREDGSLACGACRRVIPLDRERVESGASFTVRVPPDASGLRIHALATRTEQAEAAGDRAGVEVWGLLPPPPLDGAREVTLFLPTESVGVPQGSNAAPVPLKPGRPDRPRRRFDPAMRKPCATPRPPGATCVPGGAFWMGSSSDSAATYLLAPRVVALSPFWMDEHEVTVAAFRDAARRDGNLLEGVERHTGLEPDRLTTFCTFTDAPGRFDGYPVNCVAFVAARAFCQMHGGDLPTEAQFEYVGSGLSSLPFPWGRDRTACGDIVAGRGPRSELIGSSAGTFSRDCLPEPGADPVLETLGFPKPIRGRPRGRDVLNLPGGTVQDLVGSVAEWMRDGYEEQRGDCWRAATLKVDPFCPTETQSRVVRGWAWSVEPDAPPLWFRGAAPPSGADPGIAIGFRCVYPGQ